MARLITHTVLIVSLLASPVLCCCTQAALRQRVSPPTEQSSCCCCDQQKTTQVPQRSPRPSDCHCKQKQLAVSNLQIANYKLNVENCKSAFDLQFSICNFQFAISPVPQHRHDTAMPVAWFATSQDLLRALGTLRL